MDGQSDFFLSLSSSLCSPSKGRTNNAICVLAVYTWESLWKRKKKIGRGFFRSCSSNFGITFAEKKIWERKFATLAHER